MLCAGIDTLEFGLDIENYHKEFSPFLGHLKALKEEGQQLGLARTLHINGVALIVEKSGMPFYAYRLTCKDFVLGFSEKPTYQNPDIWVKLSSGFLWSYGYKEAYRRFREWFNHFRVNVLGTRISRVDICLDEDEFPFYPDDKEKFVTKAKSRAKHEVICEYSEGRELTGFSIGRGKPLLVRIYDKTREIKRSGKTWFEQIWLENGWDREKPVWRIEFQIRREFLKECSIYTVEDLFEKEDGLWAYLTNNWLELRENIGGNVSRRPLDERWKIVQNATRKMEVSPLIRERVIQGDIKRLLDQGVGILCSLGAAANKTSMEEVLEMLKKWGENKLLKEGITFKDEVQARRQRFIMFERRRSEVCPKGFNVIP